MRKVIPFTRLRLVCPLGSLVLIVLLGVLTFSFGGFNFGIDFRSGLKVQLFSSDNTANEESIRASLAGTELVGMQLQRVGEERRFFLRLPIDKKSPLTSEQALQIIREKLTNFQVEESQFIGPDVARGLSRSTFILIPVALLLILLYIWIRFKLIDAVSAIVALVHDTLFMLAAIGALRLEFSSATVAALLTIIGYSLNDTIVIFDRIRENNGLMAGKDLTLVVNTSLTQSLSRTLVTSLTTLIAIVPVILLTYGSIRTVAIQLAIGIIVGTYSSIFIATPLALYLRQRKQDKIKNAVTLSFSSRVLPVGEAAPKPKNPPPPPIKQTAEEIEQARQRHLKKKLQRQKKKK